MDALAVAQKLIEHVYSLRLTSMRAKRNAAAWNGEKKALDAEIQAYDRVLRLLDMTATSLRDSCVAAAPPIAPRHGAEPRAPVWGKAPCPSGVGKVRESAIMEENQGGAPKHLIDL